MMKRGRMIVEDGFPAMCEAYLLPRPVAEYSFAPPRRWRFDYAWPAGKIALEVEGGAWTGGRHTRGRGFVADMEKYNEAALRGWRVLRVTPDQLCTLATFEMIGRALSGRTAAA